MRLDSLAEQAVTIPEVLQEVRDERSREYLERFPHGIKSLQPAQESIDAGTDSEQDDYSF
jgi:rRNA maturation endonuclease Nob1